MVPLSPTFDSPGILARSAHTCRRVDQAITGAIASDDGDASLDGVHFVVPAEFARDDVDIDVLAPFEEWLAMLAAAGAHIHELSVPYLRAAGVIAREGGIIPAEAFMIHRDLVQRELASFDPRVGPRIAAGAHVLAADYAAAIRELRLLAKQFHADLEAVGADALLTPTTPMLPPLISDLDDNDVYLATNARSYRFTEIANRLDLPSISLTGNLDAPRPVGLLLSGRRGRDTELLDIAVLVEYCLTVSPAA
jgi:amidase/aspartyl-tRNA(Asn)/glutamyl-tRNA(Gln) amidotransferase subunit A